MEASNCDHIVGMALGAFPQQGDSDRLVHADEMVGELDEVFSYCPVCGSRLPLYTTDRNNSIPACVMSSGIA